jgi:hypothetical protein
MLRLAISGQSSLHPSTDDRPRAALPPSIAGTFSDARDYEDPLANGDHVPVDVIDRQGNGETTEYRLKLAGPQADPIWVDESTALKLCPSLLSRFLFKRILVRTGNRSAIS